MLNTHTFVGTGQHFRPERVTSGSEEPDTRFVVCTLGATLEEPYFPTEIADVGSLSKGSGIERGRARGGTGAEGREDFDAPSHMQSTVLPADTGGDLLAEYLRNAGAASVLHGEVVGCRCD